MIRILFICHGNICRSPMAEFIFKKLVADAGRSAEFIIESAGTSTEEWGNSLYPPAKAILEKHNIPYTDRTVRVMSKSDYHQYDLLIGMESFDIINMKRICGDDAEHKFHLLRDYTDRPGDISDPWYSRNFDTAYKQIYEGCYGLLNSL